MNTTAPMNGEEPRALRTKTLRNAGSSLVQLIVATVSLFVLYRVVLDILGPREFGIWSLVAAATSIVGLSNMGLTGSIVKHVADSQAAGDMHRLVGLIETTVVSVGLLSVGLSLVGAPLMKVYFGMTLTGEGYRSAVAILPIALIAFCLSMITAIYQSALYGCHLIVQRNGILIFESVSFLALSIALAPRHGLFGLVYARAAQNLITLTISIFVLKRYVRPLTWIPLRWRKVYFKELIGYALSFQFVGLLNMLMDPLTKGLLSRFGSLEMVTYFDMSSRLIGQVRAIVVNANQVLVPTFAEVSRGGAQQVETLFRKSYVVIFYVTVCLFGLLAAGLPLLGLLWLGTDQPLFVKIAAILCVGWLINTLTVPAYFASLGTGAMRTVVQSHVIMSVLNAVLGYGFGKLWGGYGVVAGWAASLAAGGLVMHLTYCKRSNFNLRGSIPQRGLGLVAFCALGLSIGYFATDWVRTLGPPELLSHLRVGKLSNESLISSTAALLCFVAIFFPPAMSHPIRGELSRWILRKRGA
jgi:O-antigen/teichoic acid export membrane protein